MRDEHRRRQHARGGTKATTEIRGDVKIYPLAAHAGDQGPRSRLTKLLCAVRLGEAVVADAHAGTAGPRAPAVEGRPGEDRPALGLHPVRVLLDELPVVTGGTATATSVRPRCLRLTAGSSTPATRRTARTPRRARGPVPALVAATTNHELRRGLPEDLNPARAIRRDQAHDRGAAALSTPTPGRGGRRRAGTGTPPLACRRGMKELDVLLLRFLEREYPQASPADRQAFARIIELQDPTLRLSCGPDRRRGPSLRHVIARIRHEP